MKLVNIEDNSVSERILNVINDFGECLRAAYTIIFRELCYSLVFLSRIVKSEDINPTSDNIP